MLSAPTVHEEEQPRPTRRLRVLLVCDSLDVGGAERHVVGLARALERAGHAPTIACSTEGALAPVARRAGLDVVPVLGSLAKRRVSLAFGYRLAQLLGRDRFDLVHAHGYASAAAAALAALPADLPLVLTEHSEAGWRRWRQRWISRLVYRRAARIVAVSDSIRYRLVSQDRVPPDRIVVIPNALLSLDEPSNDQAAPVPPRLGAGLLIGVVARLQPEKGVQFFVDAAAQVARAVGDARFVVIGDGPLRDMLIQQAQRLGLAERISFLGFRDDAPRLISRLDLVVVPSLSEGTPLVVLEAMQAGVPVVATAVGGIPEQIRHGREGWLVPPANAGALAGAMLHVLQTPDYASRLGAAGRARALACYSGERLVRQTEAVYWQALDHTRLASPA